MKANWKKGSKKQLHFKGQEGEGWKRGLDEWGWVGDGGARGRENSDPLCWSTRHWETHSRHINAFTHWHERAHKRVLLPTATQTQAGIPEGSTSLLSLPVKLTTQVAFTLAEPLQRSESVDLTCITGLWHFGSSSVSRPKVPNARRWRISRWVIVEGVKLQRLCCHPSGNNNFSHVSW